MIEKVSGKASLRVLRFLESNGRATLLQLKGCKEENVMLQGRDKRKMLVSRSVLNALHAAALISLTGQKCLLHENGHSKLRRLNGDGENFAAQHRDEVVKQIKLNGSSQKVVVNENESALTRLRRRKTPDGKPWLDDDHVEAGERLRRDFTLGQLMQKVTSSWDAAIGSSRAGRGGKADLSDSAIDARNRMDRALHAVGPDLAGVLTDVCCFLKGLENVERERRWPPRSAKLMLRVGLDILSRHYGTKAGPSKPGKTRQWGGQNYRPAIGVGSGLH